MKECLLFNLPEPVTSKRLAAAFFVFNFGILFPFNGWNLHTSRQAMPFRPNNSNNRFILHFYFKFKHFFYHLYKLLFCVASADIYRYDEASETLKKGYGK